MKILVSLCFLVSSLSIQAQKVTGYWYGKANVEVAGLQNNYLTELIISQKGTKVKGFFGYYFKDIYQSFVVKGTYDPKTKKLVITDIPIIYYQTNSTANSVDCITSFYGTLRISKVKTELIGYFYRDKKYEYTCPDLRVNYTLYTEARITDSIFKDMSSTRSFWKPQPPVPDVVMGNNAKAEAEMLASVDAVSGTTSTSTQKDGTTNAQKNTTGSSEITNSTRSPSGTSSAVATTVAPKYSSGSSETSNSTSSPSGTSGAATTTVATKYSSGSSGTSGTSKNPSKSPAYAGTTTASKNASGFTDTVALRKNSVSPTESIQSLNNKPGTLVIEHPLVPSDIVKINEDFKKRKQIVSKEIEVRSDSVRLSFYDNAIVDGDSISVFLNGKLVIAHQELTERAFNVYIQLDTNLEFNEVSMFAENLGKYPPNTALMVISDGDKRYETFLSSDFKGNATIRLKLRKNSIAGN